jgi:hypothetical protein
MERSASSLPKSGLSDDDACGIEGPGVASEGVGGIDAKVLWRRSDCVLCLDVVARGTGACCCCASWASSSSSQCLICRWYCIMRRVFCVLGTASKDVSIRHQPNRSSAYMAFPVSQYSALDHCPAPVPLSSSQSLSAAALKVHSRRVGRQLVPRRAFCSLG